jgi:hypothetical protein
MKLSNVSTKLTCMKSKAVRVIAAATLAGAFFAAAAPAAQAQHFAVGVQFGGPRYVAPAPVFYGRGPAFYDHRRFDEHEAWARHEEFVRHERFDHDHRFYDHGREGFRR